MNRWSFALWALFFSVWYINDDGTLEKQESTYEMVELDQIQGEMYPQFQ